MSDLDTVIVTFQTQLSGLMETVLKTAMCEVTRLVEDSLMEEVRRTSREVESLRTQLQWAERKLTDGGWIKREQKGRCVNCGKADASVLFDIAEERPANVHNSVMKGCDLKEEEDNTVNGCTRSCAQEVTLEATGSGELTPTLRPVKESQEVEDDGVKLAVDVKIEDVDKTFCAVHLGGWAIDHDTGTANSQNEITDTEQKQRNSKESPPTTIKQDLTCAAHTFNEDREDIHTQYAHVLAEPTQFSPADSKLAALALRRTDTGRSQDYTVGTHEEGEAALTKSSPKTKFPQLLDTVSVWPQGRSLSSSSDASVARLQISKGGDVVIKQEIIVDSDEGEEEERVDKETVSGLVSSLSLNGLRQEVLKQNISYNPPVQAALRLHAKVGANVTLQAAVQHIPRPIKKTLHTLTASAATTHSHVRHLNLTRTPSTSKLALPASVQRTQITDKSSTALTRPGLPWSSTKTHHHPHQASHVQHLPGARHLLRCGQCGKGFPHPSNLKAHLKTHTGERPFGCSLCGRSFTKLSNLKAHRRVHTGERPYCCLACGKRFTQKCNLKRHQRIHPDV